jgi:hypothetical protein
MTSLRRSREKSKHSDLRQFAHAVPAPRSAPLSPPVPRSVPFPTQTTAQSHLSLVHNAHIDWLQADLPDDGRRPTLQSDP